MEWISIAAVILGIFVLVGFYRKDLAERALFPVKTYQEASSAPSEVWRWRVPDSQLELGFAEDAETSTIRVPAAWTLENYIISGMGYLGLLFCLYIITGSLLGFFHAEFNFWLSLFLFMIIVIPCYAMLHYGARLEKITRTPDKLILNIKYGIFLNKRVAFRKTPRWKAEWKRQGLLAASTGQDGLYKFLSMTRKKLLFKYSRR